VTNTDRIWDDMPEALAEPFRILHGHVLTLHFRWSMFKQLYVSGQEPLDLMNATASNFFGHLRFIWIDEILLAAARLMDRGRGKLTLWYLVDMAVRYKARDIETQLAEKLAALEKQMEPLEEHRNERIAHNAIQPGPWQPLEVELIEGVLKGISDVMREIEAKFADGSTAFGAAYSHSDAEDALVVLRKAVIFNELFPDAVERSMILYSGHRPDVVRSPANPR
jgi:urease gamma subunit